MFFAFIAFEIITFEIIASEIIEGQRLGFGEAASRRSRHAFEICSAKPRFALGSLPVEQVDPGLHENTAMAHLEVMSRDDRGQCLGVVGLDFRIQFDIARFLEDREDLLADRNQKLGRRQVQTFQIDDREGGIGTATRTAKMLVRVFGDGADDDLGEIPF